jgi:hypothetical protein
VKTQLTLVTPKMARAWLTKNHSNRPLRPNTVAGFMNAFQAGEWKVTHQGIAFSLSGRLLDGQHRLTFISELPEGSEVPINVTQGQDEDTFDAIDIGIRRTMSDVYGLSQDLVSVGRFFAKIVIADRTAITNQSTKPFVDWITTEFEELITFSPSHRRIWSSSAVRAAAIYQMKQGHDADFVKMAYHSLIAQDVSMMPHAVQALVNQHMSGKIASARSNDLFCRSLRAFDSKQTKKINSILIGDLSAKLLEVLTFINLEMKKSPELAGHKGVKQNLHFNWNRAA